MTFGEYSLKAKATAAYPRIGNNYVYPVLGLCGEAGEVAEKIKKLIRDHNGIFNYEQSEAIAKELGDVLWYLAAVAREFNFDFDWLAQNNLDKLASRKERGVVKGEGDNR